MHTFFFQTCFGDSIEKSETMLFGYDVTDEQYEALIKARHSGLSLKEVSSEAFYSRIFDAAIEEWKHWCPREDVSEYLREALIRDSLICVDFVTDTKFSKMLNRGKQL